MILGSLEIAYIDSCRGNDEWFSAHVKVNVNVYA